MKHAIVTGGAGFIGRHLVRLLNKQGYRVTIIDSLATGAEDPLFSEQHISLIKEPIQTWNYKNLNEPVDAIFHLAANASVQASWNTPIEAHNDNLTATIQVAQWAAHWKVKRIVYASSAAVYGVPQQLPIHEAHPQEAISPYGYQKLWGERYLQLFAKQSGFSAVALRLFNVFGPGQNPASHYSGVITLFTNAMQANQDINVFGDGKQTRDFVFVEDVARAFLLAAQLSLEPGKTEVFNIGSQAQTSLLDLIDTLKACIPNWQGSVVFKDALPGDIRDSLANSQKAAEQLGFKSAVSLKNGLEALLKS